MKFEHTIGTSGGGLWSDTIKDVEVTEIELVTWADEGEVAEYGELRVFFDTDTWNVKEDGLIYTDDQFMDDLLGHLEVAEFDDSDVSYSEQGMQGKDYVSFDVGDKFIESWNFKEWAKSELAGK